MLIKLLFKGDDMKYFFMLFLLCVSFSVEAGECDFIQFNKCQSCDNPLAFNVGSDEACAFLCPNRKVNYENSGSMVITRNCALKKCPENYPYSSANGSCFATKQEAEDGYVTLAEENTNNDNILSGTYTTAPLAENGKCPDDLPLLYASKCFSCDESDDLSIPEEDCAKCPNRVYKYYPKWDVARCERKAPAGKPLRRWDGAFFSCDEEKAVRVDTHCNIDEDCEDLCPNRTILYSVGGNVPSVPNCPPDKPLMDDEGICFACDMPVEVGLTFNPRLCERFCPHSRRIWGRECVLNAPNQK